MLTLQKLKDMEPGEIFATGIAVNAPSKIHLTDHRIGEKIQRVAVRVNIHDWTIYYQWASKWRTDNLIKKLWNKMYSAYAKQLVPCDDEALNMYRK